MKTFFLVTIPRVLLGVIFLISAVDGFWWLATGANLIHPPTSPRPRNRPKRFGPT